MASQQGQVDFRGEGRVSVTTQRGMKYVGGRDRRGPHRANSAGDTDEFRFHSLSEAQLRRSVKSGMTR